MNEILVLWMRRDTWIDVL